jgi:prevent-host-death family protein
MTTKTRKINVVGLKELRLHTEKYIREVRRGRSFLVLRKSRPVFKLEPVDSWGDEGTWETVADFNKIKKGGIPASEVLKALRRMK